MLPGQIVVPGGTLLKPRLIEDMRYLRKVWFHAKKGKDYRIYLWEKEGGDLLKERYTVTVFHGSTHRNAYEGDNLLLSTEEYMAVARRYKKLGHEVRTEDSIPEKSSKERFQSRV